MTTIINPFERLAPSDGSANIHHFINGQLRAGNSGRYGEVYNPAQGRVSGRLAFATKAEVDEAVSAAAKAFPAWSRRSGERGSCSGSANWSNAKSNG
jgi:delta 1-pyrroline-5-carboxylate dehydrogenase